MQHLNTGVWMPLSVIPLKVLAIMLIIGALATAGTVYTLYSGQGLTLEMQFLDVQQDGDDLLVTVKLIIRNANPEPALVRSATVTIMDMSRDILFVHEQLAPPAFSIEGSGVTEKVFTIRVQNVADLGSEVFIIVDGEFSVDGNPFPFHREQAYSI